MIRDKLECIYICLRVVTIQGRFILIITETMVLASKRGERVLFF